MDCRPARTAVLNYGARWEIEPMFSDFKSRGFELEDSQLGQADRLERLVLIMAMALACLRRAALKRQIILHRSKKTREQTDPGHWSFKKLYRSLVSLFKRGLRRLMRCLQNDPPLPAFCEIMRN